MRKILRAGNLFAKLNQTIDRMYDGILDFLNHYSHDDQIRRDTNISLALAIVGAGTFPNGTDSQSEFEFPSSFPSAPSTEFHGNIDGFSYEAPVFFEILSDEELCVDKDQGLETLRSLAGEFTSPHTISLLRTRLLFDETNGDWGIFQLDDNKLCHVFSGVNFSVEEPDFIQDEFIGGAFGENYLERSELIDWNTSWIMGNTT